MTPDDTLPVLLKYLQARSYRFHAVTPATHARVLARPTPDASSLRDVFGWNQPFAEDRLDAELLELMRRAGIMRRHAEGAISRLRVASLGDDLFLHSAFPTDEADAVFFGPDTYRFVRFMRERWPAKGRPRIIDMGAGSGAGGIAAARLAPNARVMLVDSNPSALRLAQANALAAGVAVDLRQGDALPVGADVVIANPPYMMDASRRAYRDGGELFGGEVALQWTRDALARLSPGGTMLLYTGAAIVGGASPLVDALQGACTQAGAAIEVEEIDPDVFGEELDRQAYGEVERIAAIGVVIGAPA
jgi:methylase of polypeptide subunit release factors